MSSVLAEILYFIISVKEWVSSLFRCLMRYYSRKYVTNVEAKDTPSVTLISSLEVLELFNQRICFQGSHENYSEFVKLKTAICALGLITTVGLSTINCLFEWGGM